MAHLANEVTLLIAFAPADFNLLSVQHNLSLRFMTITRCPSLTYLRRISLNSVLLPLLLVWFFTASINSNAQDRTKIPPLKPLSQIPVPTPSNLGDFIEDYDAVLILGKALFWDMQLGSDGVMACATCHYHAGADNRSRHQVAPGLLRWYANGAPNPDRTFQLSGPNYALKASDFPLRKLRDTNDPRSAVLADRNDIVSSQGISLRQFIECDDYGNEVQRPQVDPVFCVGRLTTRRVEPRNTPTVINAVFNQRNFWDGRAADIFNGVNPFGPRDKDARVFYANSDDDIRTVSVAINNASLASQAVGPPLSTFEMSAAGRTFPDVAKKLLKKRPLARQMIDPTDSVLGTWARGDKGGLIFDDYEELVKYAFRQQWWQYNGKVTMPSRFGTAGGTAHANSLPSLARVTPSMSPSSNNNGEYTQIEANFSLFFGLAVQLYQATLVSDQTPFDRYAAGDATALTAMQRQGLFLFYNKGKCGDCHSGPEFTSASVNNIANLRIETMGFGRENKFVYDAGFYNLGVRPTLEDISVGDTDPFGYPFSEARLLSIFGPQVYKQVVGHPAPMPINGDEFIAADGLFKTPTLRNIELTAPYFHTGGFRTLNDVIDFYNRGGDFRIGNERGVHPSMTPLGLTNTEKNALVAFLKSLTDERVRYHRAPFDHPQLFIPNGHVGTTKASRDNGLGHAVDVTVELPATGRTGGRPLPNFLE